MNELRMYKKESGGVPTLDLINSLSVKLLEKTKRHIALLEEVGVGLREPYANAITRANFKGLRKLRIHQGNTHVRLFYIIDDNYFILLNGFVKKTRTTPDKELNIAYKYKQDYEAQGLGSTIELNVSELK